MKLTHYDREYIFEKTDGRCHICGKRLAFANYAAHGARGAWEIDHSKPRARSGTDHLHNLWPACISCNRSKQARSTRSARAAYGRTRAPMSRVKQGAARERNTLIGGGGGAVVGGMIAGPPGAMLGALLCGALASTLDVE